MKQRKLALPALAALALAACQKPTADDSNIAIDNGVNAANADIETLPPSETSAPVPVPNSVEGVE